MTAHRTAGEIELAAAGELEGDAHIRACPECAAALLETLRMKRAVREAMPRFAPPAGLRQRIAPASVTPRERPAAVPRWWLAVAAGLILVITGFSVLRQRGAAARELVDLHATIIAAANPIEVVSTDRHTVKPWFEGRVPFAVDVPELTNTPFRLAGGRVVFWRGRTGAYLLVTKGAHRISLFGFDEDDAPRVGEAPRQTIESWTRNGVRWTAVADLPRNDLAALRVAFTR
jgi:anti-sigma factor RsiW